MALPLNAKAGAHGSDEYGGYQTLEEGVGNFSEQSGAKGRPSTQAHMRISRNGKALGGRSYSQQMLKTVAKSPQRRRILEDGSQPTAICTAAVMAAHLQEGRAGALAGIKDAADPANGAIYGRNGMNSMYLERWLNEALRKNELIQYPEELRMPEHKAPLDRFDLSRAKLLKIGYTAAEIDRLYRGLFVHSSGFYQMLKDQTAIVDQRARSKNECAEYICTNIWTTFHILLQHAYDADHQTLLSELLQRHEKEMARMTREAEAAEKAQLAREAELRRRMGE